MAVDCEIRDVLGTQSTDTVCLDPDEAYRMAVFQLEHGSFSSLDKYNERVRQMFVPEALLEYVLECYRKPRRIACKMAFTPNLLEWILKPYRLLAELLEDKGTGEGRRRAAELRREVS
jgi:hypothetical protein